MNIIIRGVRGSIPTSNPSTIKYGGNTSCVDVTAEGWQLVLDAGSGICNSTTGDQPPNKRVDVLLTHLHFDHIQGLGFFKPLFDPSMEVHIWGPASSRNSLHSRLSRYLSPPLFPVHIRDLPCKLSFHEIDKSEFSIGPFFIQSRYVIHPGPTVGFRIQHNEKVFSYIPDHEPALGLYGMPADKQWISGIDLATNSDLLLHDAQYSSDEYRTRIGWGHSSMEAAVSFAGMAGVKKILLAHHDPGHSDELLENMVAALPTQQNLTVALAAEGMHITL